MLLSFCNLFYTATLLFSLRYALRRNVNPKRNIKIVSKAKTLILRSYALFCFSSLNFFRPTKILLTFNNCLIKWQDDGGGGEYSSDMHDEKDDR